MAQSSSFAILTYHSIDDSGSVLSISPRIFAEHMGILAELGVDVVRLQDVVGRTMNGKTEADAAVAITFDDGFRDRKSTRLNSSHIQKSRMPSSA